MGAAFVALSARLRTAVSGAPAWREARWVPLALAFAATFIGVLLLGAMLLPDVPHRHARRIALKAPPSHRRPPAATAIAPFEPPGVAMFHRRAATAKMLIRSRTTEAREDVEPPPPSVPTPLRQPGAVPAAVHRTRSEPPVGGVVRVTRISLWGTPNRPWGSITASGPVRYQLRDVRPGLVVVDLSPARLDLMSGTPPAALGRIARVRAGQFNTTTVRVVLELTEAAPVRVTASRDGTAIIISLPEPTGVNAGMPGAVPGEAARRPG